MGWVQFLSTLLGALVGGAGVIAGQVMTTRASTREGVLAWERERADKADDFQEKTITEIQEVLVRVRDTARALTDQLDD